MLKDHSKYELGYLLLETPKSLLLAPKNQRKRQRQPERSREASGLSHAFVDLRVRYLLQILLEKDNGPGIGVTWNQWVWGEPLQPW